MDVVEPGFTTDSSAPGAVRSLLVDARRSEPTGVRVIVFFPGFMLTPWSYRSLFASTVSDRISVVSPQMYRRRPLPRRPGRVESR